MEKLFVGQRPLALGRAPMKADPINTGDLIGEVQHLGSSLARTVRHGAALPGDLRPELDGRPLPIQISSLWRAYCVYTYREARGNEERAQNERYCDILRMYEDLAKAGYKLQQADGLRDRHVKVLLQLWRARAKPTTVRKQWAILRQWMLVLGRPGMMGPIEQYWPDIPPRERKAAGENPRDKTLTEAQMTELMRARDLTHWYVERLRRELQLTVEEALHFDKVLAANCLEGRLVLQSVATGQWRTVQIKDHASLMLVQDVQAFIAQRGRKRLMWPDMTPAAALKRHQNRLSYLRAKTARAQEPAAGDAHQLSGGSHE